MRPDAAKMLHDVSVQVRGAADAIHMMLMTISVSLEIKNPGALTDIKLELESVAQELEDMAEAAGPP